MCDVLQAFTCHLPVSLFPAHYQSCVPDYQIACHTYVTSSSSVQREADHEQDYGHAEHAHSKAGQPAQVVRKFVSLFVVAEEVSDKRQK